ncbi:MAG: DGQHR domain-containing protein [Candidatus Pacebacteria bacterium]|nr:DGQHR domain-containing protein [Candidatus Paceibacterota bacterium]
MPVETVEVNCLKTNFDSNDVFTQSLKVKDVIKIQYVATRGVNEEEGAVQRVLSPIRVASIKKFILSNHIFFNTFILNWTKDDELPSYNDGKIKIPIIEHSAQVLDGQHRLAGLKEAMKERPEIGEKEIIVSICLCLGTQQAANIFLNINSEQKPIPKSLIYDLFGEIEDNQDHPINRAADIAQEFNENSESPYYGRIKYPGTPKGEGNIELSTIISSLKQHLTEDGVFAHYNLKTLTYQKQVMLRYFQAIRDYYNEKMLWDSRTKNPFLRNYGFHGAMDYLTSVLLSKCAEKKSFTRETFKEFLSLDVNNILLHSTLKNLDGKTARKRVKEYLETNINKSIPEEKEYEF